MFFWIILKYLPMLAMVTGLDASFRYRIYATLGILICGVVFVTLCLRRVTIKSIWPPLALGFLFLFSLSLNLRVTLRQEMLSETLTTLRGLFLLISLWLMVRNLRYVRFWFVVFYGCASAIQIAGLILSWKTVESGVALDTQSFDRQRILGIYDNTWSVVYSAVCYLGITGAMAFASKSTFVRVTCFTMALLAIAGAMLTISRIALITLPFVILGVIIESIFGTNPNGTQQNVRTRLRLYGVLSSVLLFSSFAAAVKYADVAQYYQKLWISRLFDHDANDKPRWTTIEAGVNMFLDHPLVGVGWDAISGRAEEYGSQIDASAHNLPVDAASQGGIFGLLFGLGLEFGIPLWLLSQSRKLPGRYVYIGAWIALIVCNTVVSTLMLESHWDLFCFWTMHIAVARRMRSKKKCDANPVPIEPEPFGRSVIRV